MLLLCCFGAAVPHPAPGKTKESAFPGSTSPCVNGETCVRIRRALFLCAYNKLRLFCHLCPVP